MTYLLVNFPFLAVAIAAAGAAALLRRADRTIIGAVLVTLAGLFLLTAVFDNVIIAAGIVAYDHSITSGLMVGIAPVEDFAYALAAGLGLPALWLLLPAKRGTTRRNTSEREASR